jgi:cytochrome oxidase Cu insertion factor (SCO1/SenC/PrrC family)
MLRVFALAGLALAELALTGLALTGLALAGLMFAGIAPSPAQTSGRSAAELMDAVMWNREPIGGPFALVDHTGKPRTNEDFRGRLMLVYFGFTWCPDVCPTDLQNIGLAMEELGEAAERVQPIFITVDPERDTAAHLADYVPMFHPRLIGLTGEADAIRKVADAYKVYYARVALKGEDYTVDHSAFIYLMDADGTYLGFFPPGTGPDSIAQTVSQRLMTPKR